MRLSMQQKIALWSCICLLVTSGIIIGYSAMTMRKEAAAASRQAVEDAKVLAGEVGEKFAGRIKAELEVALDSARTLSEALSGVKDEENPVELGRDEVNSILKIILDRNPQFVGIYTAWEPNAFDGMDRGYADDTGHDATGRFIPYWNRNEAGDITVEALLDYEVQGAGDYYQIPKTTKKEAIIDPYLYPVQGKDTLLTSLVVPIMAKDTFYGIAGIDLRLDFLQELADNAKDLYDGAAKVVLISYNGTLAGVTGQAGLVGKHMEAVHKDWEEDIQYFQQGKKQVEMDEGRIAVFVPIRIGKTVTPWCVNILVPVEIVTRNADTQLANSTKNMWKMIGISAVCVVAALILMWIVARNIANPIKNVMTGVNESAEMVSQASDQVSTSSTSMAEGASEQAASIEEASAAMEEMSSMTKQNADNAVNADTLMKEANQIVNKANDSMAKLTASMEEISKASDETSKIIKTIDEIAFQTNLLALNAAVEAARAGEAGAGFAVVADEVRSLAMRAADAARDTAGLIEGTVKKVNEGADLVSTTNEEFTNVAESADKVGRLIAEISQASKEQATGIDQVNGTIASMDKVVQTNAADAEESSAAAIQLNAQANELKDYVVDLVTLVTGEKGKQADINRIRQVQAPPPAKPAEADHIDFRPATVIEFKEDPNKNF